MRCLSALRKRVRQRRIAITRTDRDLLRACLQRRQGGANLGLEISTLCSPVGSNGIFSLYVGGVWSRVVGKSVFVSLAPCEQLRGHRLTEAGNSAYSVRLDVCGGLDPIGSKRCRLGRADAGDGRCADGQAG